jgi:hypothetical protein
MNPSSPGGELKKIRNPNIEIRNKHEDSMLKSAGNESLVEGKAPAIPRSSTSTIVFRLFELFEFRISSFGFLFDKRFSPYS